MLTHPLGFESCPSEQRHDQSSPLLHGLGQPRGIILTPSQEFASNTYSTGSHEMSNGFMKENCRACLLWINTHVHTVLKRPLLPSMVIPVEQLWHLHLCRTHKPSLRSNLPPGLVSFSNAVSSVAKDTYKRNKNGIAVGNKVVLSAMLSNFCMDNQYVAGRQHLGKQEGASKCGT